ncbi:DUF1799 domain-containing protein [Pseudomonas sp. TWP3-1]|uniref:DUF1799 domain-containing protein n=1 Tax=Pseudomonas sp. TWP3-1 TaxID=2804631 RepID=UPI003CED59CF
MYERGPSDADLAALGMSRADIPGEECEVLPDNWRTFILFNALSTQWRSGMGGPTGLDYTSIRDVARYLSIKKKQIAEIFHDLQVMEAEALLVMSESK